MIRKAIGKAVLKYEEGDDPEGYDEPVLGIITNVILENKMYKAFYKIKWINGEEELCIESETKQFLDQVKDIKRYADDP